MDMVCAEPDIGELTSQDLDSSPQHAPTGNVNHHGFKPPSLTEGGSDAGTKTLTNGDLNQIGIV